MRNTTTLSICIVTALALTLLPCLLTAQELTLDQAQTSLEDLKADLAGLDNAYTAQLEAAVTKAVDTSPKDEFETTDEYKARIEAAKEARRRLTPEYERMKLDRRREIGAEIDIIITMPYPNPVRLFLGTYDADNETFPFLISSPANNDDASEGIKLDYRHPTVVTDPIGAEIWEVDVLDDKFKNKLSDYLAQFEDQRTVIINGWYEPRTGLIINYNIDIKEHIEHLFIEEGKLILVFTSPQPTTIKLDDILLEFFQGGRGIMPKYNARQIHLGETGTIEIPRMVAREVKLNLSTLKHFGYWQMNIDGTSQLVAVAVYSEIGKHVAVLSGQIKPIKLHHREPLASEGFHKEFGRSLAVSSMFHDYAARRDSHRINIQARERVDIQAISEDKTDPLTMMSGDTWTWEWIKSEGRILLLISDVEFITVEIDSAQFDIGNQYGFGILDLTFGANFTKLDLITTSPGENNFLSALYEDQPKGGAKTPILPPVLSASVSFSESSGNDVLEAGEEGTLEIIIMNTGKASAYGVGVVLEGEFIGLSFPTKHSIGEIPPGESEKVSIPLKADMRINDGQALLTCTFSELNYFWPNPVRVAFNTRAFLPPMLTVSDVSLVEDSLADNEITPGEVVTVLVQIMNEGKGLAENVSASIRLGNSNMFLAGSKQSKFDLGQIESMESADFLFQIFANKRADSLAVYVNLTERYGKYGQNNFRIDLPFKKPLAGGSVIYSTTDIERDIPTARDQRSNAVALIIANRNYTNPDVPDVSFAARDGEFMKRYITSALGYREGNVFYYQDASQGQMRIALRRLQNLARDNSDVFFYYVGHGAPDPESKQGYFVPTDADPNYISSSGISLEEFYRELSKTPGKSITVVLDACFSGGSDQGPLIRNVSGPGIEVVDPALTDPRMTVFTSSTDTEVSSWFPEKKHSLYTYYFLKGLQGAADADKDRSLTVAELQAYLVREVPYEARRLNNRRQTPTATFSKGKRVLVRYRW